MKANNTQSYQKKWKVKDTDTEKEFTLTEAGSTWGDRNFHKVFMKDFRETLKGIESQKFKVVLFLMEKMTPLNEVMSTYQEIAAGAKTSYQTVVRTIEMLEKDNFLCHKGKVLLVNPNVVFRGRYESRAYVLDAYREARKENGTPKKEEMDKLNKELSDVKDKLKKAQETVISLKEEKRKLEKEMADRKKPGRKPKPKEEGKAARKKTRTKAKEEKKDSTAQTSEPNPRPEEEKKDGTGQTSEQET